MAGPLLSAAIITKPSSYAAEWPSRCHSLLGATNAQLPRLHGPLAAERTLKNKTQLVPCRGLTVATMKSVSRVLHQMRDELAFARGVSGPGRRSKTHR